MSTHFDISFYAMTDSFVQGKTLRETDRLKMKSQRVKMKALYVRRGERVGCKKQQQSLVR